MIYPFSESSLEEFPIGSDTVGYGVPCELDTVADKRTNRNIQEAIDLMQAAYDRYMRKAD